MYQIKGGISIEATLEFKLGGKTCRLENIVLTIVGDQKPKASYSNVKVQWKVGANAIDFDIPLNRVKNYHNFWVPPEEVA